jgi:hypothetical protein
LARGQPYLSEQTPGISDRIIPGLRFMAYPELMRAFRDSFAPIYAVDALGLMLALIEFLLRSREAALVGGLLIRTIPKRHALNHARVFGASGDPGVRTAPTRPACVGVLVGGLREWVGVRDFRGEMMDR